PFVKSHSAMWNFFQKMAARRQSDNFLIAEFGSPKELSKWSSSLLWRASPSLNVGAPGSERSAPNFLKRLAALRSSYQVMAKRQWYGLPPSLSRYCSSESFRPRV